MKKKLSLILLLILALSFFAGCSGGSNWSAAKYTKNQMYTSIELGSGKYSAEYRVIFPSSVGDETQRKGRVEIYISWKSDAKSYPNTANVTIYADGEIKKHGAEREEWQAYAVFSLTDQTDGKEGFENRLTFKDYLVRSDYKTIRVAAVLSGKDGKTTETDDTFNLRNLVNTVERYAKRKGINLSPNQER